MFLLPQTAPRLAAMQGVFVCGEYPASFYTTVTV